MFLRGLWDVSLNGDLIDIFQRHLMPAGLVQLVLVKFSEASVEWETTRKDHSKSVVDG